MSAIAMKVESVTRRPPRAPARAKDTANIVGALIGGFATGAAIAVLLWQLV